MKILFCRSDLKLAGPAKLIYESAKALKGSNHDVLTLTGGGEFTKHFENNVMSHYVIPELRLENRGVLSTFKAALRVREYINSEGIEVIHTFNAHAAITCILAAFLSAKRIKVVNTVLGNGKEGLLKYIPCKFIAVSTSVKDKLVKFGIRSERISVVYNSIIPTSKVIDLKPLKAKQCKFDDSKNEKLVFCSIAMFTGKKGHERIIENMAKLSDNLEYEIIFIGDGPTRIYCEKLADERGIGDKCKFIGAQDDVYKWLDKSDVFIHMPDMETFGMVLIEAMARGLPVISTNVGGIPEVIGNKAGKLLSLMPAEEELLSSIEYIKQNYTEMSDESRERVLELFTLEKLTKNYESVYTTN